jgi:membrane fusion protein (multidrug efflux system)
MSPVSSALTPAVHRAPTRAVILLFGCEPEDAAGCAHLLPGNVEVVLSDSRSEVWERLTTGEIAVLCLGPRIAGETAQRLLQEMAVSLPEMPTVNVVLAAGPELDLFQALISNDRIFYISQYPLAIEDWAAVLEGAIAEYGRRMCLPLFDDGERHRLSAEALEAAQRTAAQPDLAATVQVTNASVRELVRAERAYCLLYDAADDVLWAPEPGGKRERRESAAVGLVSFVARTGRPAAVERLERDGRYDRDADNPEGFDDERFLATPIRATSEPRVLAVLAAVRAAAAPAFGSQETATLALLAEQLVPTFLRWETRWRGGLAEPAEDAAAGSPAERIFRREALVASKSERPGEGDPLRISPDWIHWTYRLVLAVVAVGLLYAGLGTVHEYASGPAVIQMGGRTELRANATGAITAIEVKPGDHVVARQLLLRFYGADELAELDRINTEFQQQLINHLRNFADRGAEGALINLRAERRLAQAHLEERSLRAPQAGVVSDLRVRPGQHLTPGQTLLAIVGEALRPSAVVLLPGRYRPQLKAGMPMRLELEGYRYAYQHLTVDSVGDEIVGPDEAKRYLGEEIADAVHFEGPVVLVSAHLPSRSFRANGRSLEYHGGMWGSAEVPVRSERILFTLLPWLKSLFGKP